MLLAGVFRRNIDTTEAVKQGVIRDIAKNVNVGAMDVNVVSVRFRDKEADAVVSFAPKGGTAAQGMTMNYTLERQGNEWHIKKRAQGDMQKHAAQGQAQAGPWMLRHLRREIHSCHPGILPLAPERGSKALPPGHPPLTVLRSNEGRDPRRRSFGSLRGRTTRVRGR